MLKHACNDCLTSNGVWFVILILIVAIVISITIKWKITINNNNNNSSPLWPAMYCTPWAIHMVKRVDLSNAFKSVNRHAVLTTVQDVCPTILPCGLNPPLSEPPMLWRVPNIFLYFGATGWPSWAHALCRSDPPPCVPIIHYTEHGPINLILGRRHTNAHPTWILHIPPCPSFLGPSTWSLFENA